MGAAPVAESDAEMAQRSDSVACSIPEENTLLSHSRCCFSFPCFRSRRSSSFSSSTSPTSPSSTSSPPWWEHSWLSGGIQAIKKIREWSEIVAGPKWKTFIRRLNRKGATGNNNNRHGRFQYDPLSYALNFDEGQHLDFDEYDDYGNPVGGAGGGFRDFSSRYASVSGSGKPLKMDDARVVNESFAVGA